MKKTVFLALTLVWVLLVPQKAFAVSGLLGTPKSLQRENEVAKTESLTLVEDDRVLEELKSSGKLVSMPVSVNMDKNLDMKWWYCLPCTQKYLDDIAIRYTNKFQKRFRVTSVVRTLEREVEISYENPNAAPAYGGVMSFHLYGATFDVSKFGMTKEEIQWVQKELLGAENKNYIEATEESIKVQCFHIMVFSSYCLD